MTGRSEMAETKPGRKPTRDYPSLSETPWTLWETMFTRKSCRKYVPGDFPDGLTAELEEFVGLASRVRGVRPDTLLPVTDPVKGDMIRQRSHKGITSKINIWLSRAPLHSFLVASLPREDVHSDRPRELPSVCMALEDCVLWLTAHGMGTCWLAGVNGEEIKNLLGLGADYMVPLVVCFGNPSDSSRAINYDRLLNQMQGRRRKPMSSIASVETMDRSYEPGALASGGFSAAGTQDIGGLLQRIDTGGGSEDIPIDLAIEACFEAARIAPSGSNAQAWHFTAVRDPERLRRLSAACGSENDWRAGIVGAGQASSYIASLLDKPFWMVDVPIALSHISLMAASMGCGVSAFTEFDESDVNALVQLKKGYRSVGVLGLR